MVKAGKIVKNFTQRKAKIIHLFLESKTWIKEGLSHSTQQQHQSIKINTRTWTPTLMVHSQWLCKTIRHRKKTYKLEMRVRSLSRELGRLLSKEISDHPDPLLLWIDRKTMLILEAMRSKCAQQNHSQMLVKMSQLLLISTLVVIVSLRTSSV